LLPVSSWAMSCAILFLFGEASYDQ
jgi:hypothetical protein